MINYTSLEEAWGIEDKTIEKNEISDNNDVKMKQKQQNTVKESFKNESLKNLNKCETIDHILSCDKCLEKLKQKLKIEQKIIIERPQKKQQQPQMRKNTNLKNTNLKNTNLKNTNLKNTNLKNIIEGFNFKIPYNKHLVLYITIIGILILSILLVHSYRKPVKMNTNNKKFYIFPEDLDKLKSLIDIARR
jgi:hypothetical protein